jgi:hypothetical protein
MKLATGHPFDDEHGTGAKYSFSDVAAQTASTAGYQLDVRHEIPPVFWLDGTLIGNN